MKAILKRKRLVASQSLGASFNSSQEGVLQCDKVSLQSVYTGSPAGTLEVQASLQDNPGASDWVTLPVTATLPTSASPILVDIETGSWQWIRIVFTRTSGTGTIDIDVSYKRIGD